MKREKGRGEGWNKVLGKSKSFVSGCRFNPGTEKRVDLFIYSLDVLEDVTVIGLCYVPCTASAQIVEFAKIRPT
jgi:hypothetical protein